jgi:hypothetical protein
MKLLQSSKCIVTIQQTHYQSSHVSVSLILLASLPYIQFQKQHYLYPSQPLKPSSAI